jgi:predicted nucleic acid-binding protein
MIVVPDTSPLNYLILTGYVHLLEALYGRVVIPRAVWDELRKPGAPAPVREWTDGLPGWIEVREPAAPDAALNLDPGERDAITLALELRADLVLLDERRGRREAVGRGLAVTGTLGVLDAAAERGLIKLPEAIAGLRQTTFRVPPSLLQELLARGRERDEGEAD